MQNIHIPKKILLGILGGIFLILFVVITRFVPFRPITSPSPTLITPTDIIKRETEEIPKVIPAIHISSSPGIKPNPSVQYELNFNTSALPHQAPLYKVSKKQINTNLAVSIAKDLGFSSPPQEITQKILYWNTPNSALEVHLDTGFIQYSSTDETHSFPISRIDDTIMLAQNFLIQKKIISSSSQIDREHIIFYDTLSENPHLVNTFNDAGYIQMTFNLIENSIKLLNTYGTSEGVDITISKKGAVRKISYYFSGITILAERNVNLISGDNIKDVIRANQGSIIQPFEILDLEHIGITPQPSRITLNQIELGYILNQESNLFHPIFVLKGSTLLDTGHQENIIMYLDALQK